MKQDEFCRHLAAITPDMPEHFSNHVDCVLEKIMQQGEKGKSSKAKTILFAGVYVSKRALIVAMASLIMLFATVAFAATQWHIFENLSFLVGEKIPDTADDVMQGGLHQETVNQVEITIQEAGYDGRTLLLQYSYRMLDVNEPLCVTAEETYHDSLPYGFSPDTPMKGLRDGAQEMLLEHNVGWWVDCIWLNGEPIDMPTSSGSVYTGSTIPGEIIITEYWRLDNVNMPLSGVVDITMPIGEMQSADYRKTLIDRDTGKYRMPDRGVVTFSFNAKDTISQVVTEHPNQELILFDAKAKVSEVVYSPLMTYITLNYQIPLDLKAEPITSAEDQDWINNSLWSFWGNERFSQWIYSLELVDENGKTLFPDHHGISVVGSTWAEFVYPHIGNMPKELWLAPIQDGKADMTQAVRVK